MTSPYDRNGQRDMAQQYLRQQIEQAGPVEQVLMLYDGAMRFLLQAKAAIERHDIQARCNANQRAMEIMAYLLDMVNPETGGAAGKKLFGIYSSILKRMLQIDFENSAAVCDELVTNLRVLRTGMAKGLAQAQGNAQTATQPAAQAAVAKPATVVAAPSNTTDTPPDGVRRNAVA